MESLSMSLTPVEEITNTYTLADPRKEYRMNYFVTEFSDILRKITSDEVPNGQLLRDSGYSAHPSIHTGYYDDISPAGELMVYEGLSDKLVRKHETWLTNDGLFVLKNKVVSRSAIKNEMCQHFLYGTKQSFIDSKDTYYRSDHSTLVRKFSPDDFIMFVNTQSAFNYIRQAVGQAIRANHILPLVNDPQERVVWETIDRSHLQQKVQMSLEACVGNGDVKVVEKTSREGALRDAEFLRLNNEMFSRNGLRLHIRLTAPVTVQNQHSVAQMRQLTNGQRFMVPNISNYNMRDVQRIIDVCSRPLDSLEHLEELRRTSLPSYDPNALFGVTSVYPDICMLHMSAVLQQPASAVGGELRYLVGENHSTDNNRGRLLSYSSKVEHAKQSFMLTDGERAFQDQLRKSKKPDQADTRPIFMGVELEFVARGEGRSDEGLSKLISKIANSKFGDHAIMKSDASIGSYGLEIVTVPATLEYHRQMFIENFFSKDNSFHRDLMSTERCGLHVHISKNVFTPITLGKFIAFINSPSNANFMDKMSGRPPNTYCKRVAVKGKNAKGVDVSAVIAKKVCEVRNGKIGRIAHRHMDYDRREAVNLNNTHTIELRMFKATNDKNNFLRKLEFCESLVKFVREHSLQQMTVYDYVNFILRGDNKKVYSRVLLWLATKGYVDHEIRKVKDTGRIVNIYSKNKVVKPDTIYHQKGVK
jgi:hypothetical protein